MKYVHVHIHTKITSVNLTISTALFHFFVWFIFTSPIRVFVKPSPICASNFPLELATSSHLTINSQAKSAGFTPYLCQLLTPSATPMVIRSWVWKGWSPWGASVEIRASIKKNKRKWLLRWLFESTPFWKICASQIGLDLPKFRGKTQQSFKFHHLED